MCGTIITITWCWGIWKRCTISQHCYNLCRVENTVRSEVETYPSSLWSHREHWRGLASFCDSSGHASCKREEGIRGGESEEDYNKQTSISSHSMSSSIKQVEELYVLWIEHFKNAMQLSGTVILFKGIFSSQMHLSVQKTFLMHQSELARVMLSFECFALWGR